MNPANGYDEIKRQLVIADGLCCLTFQLSQDCNAGHRVDDDSIGIVSSGWGLLIGLLGDVIQLVFIVEC